MSAETVISNATIVLEDEVIHGSVLIRDGLVADITSGNSRAGEDFEGDYLIPGLIELHTDHLEGHFAPRPRVRWNPIAAVLAHDAQISTSGITTVFDALRVGLDEGSETNVDDMRELAGAIESSVRNNRLRADHFIHLRCEVSAPDCLEAFSYFDDNTRVRLASLMDHAPGQRQFVNIEAYKAYHLKKFKFSEEKFLEYCEIRMAQSVRHSAMNRLAISNACQARGIVLASHDDATEAHVEEAIEQGIRVAEFPTTLQAAAASRKAGLSVLMGAPNVVRGGSHSGNVSARSLAEEGYLDILSSDYIPFSLIQSVFFLSEVVDGISLPQAVRFASLNPARATGLPDRGVIAPGKRADLVRVRVDEHVPIVRTVWREGQRVV
ncbi:MAG: alpha-D-ribose 1-methylphosphonate 5-triphosphate diphosphatase [Phyllobacterium sp.]